jgi:hypothetical protein
MEVRPGTLVNTQLKQAIIRLGVIVVLVGAGWTLAPAATFEATTPSFRVHLGVVSAVTLRKAPELIDWEKRLHGNLIEQPDMQHVLVSVFSVKSGQRVEDATVIAAMRSEERKAATIERPLERMRTAGAISYGNFFEMPRAGNYEITVRIYLPQGNRAETVKFDYAKPGE